MRFLWSITMFNYSSFMCSNWVAEVVRALASITLGCLFVGSNPGSAKIGIYIFFFKFYFQYNYVYHFTHFVNDTKLIKICNEINVCLWLISNPQPLGLKGTFPKWEAFLFLILNRKTHLFKNLHAWPHSHHDSNDIEKLYCKSFRGFCLSSLHRVYHCAVGSLFAVRNFKKFLKNKKIKKNY